MKDSNCVRFLQWCLPYLGFQWKGFRKVRRQVCKRILKRAAELSIGSLDDYRDYLIQNPAEWEELRIRCRVTISRFYRDRAVINALRWEVIPKLVHDFQNDHTVLRIWSCGCASGEEPYTLKLIWTDQEMPESGIDIVATDLDRNLLRRASEGVYPSSSLRELSKLWQRRYFDSYDGMFKIKESLKHSIHWLEQGVLREMPSGPFHLILCRYLVFTYFDLDSQTKTLNRIADLMSPGGILVIGQTENLPRNDQFDPWFESLKIYRRK